MNEVSPAMPPLTVNVQYIKDLSFEVPGAPAIFADTTDAPEVPIQVDVQYGQVGPSMYEVLLHIKINAHLNERPVFIVDVTYGGVFTVHVPEEQVRPILLIEGPHLLFPFLRAIISDLTRDGGFPPLLIQPLDFAQLYHQRAAQA